MSYYRTCPNCGAALDPGERCDCLRESNGSREEAVSVQRKTAQGAANTQDGKAEQKSGKLQCSASSLSENREECQV